MTLIIYRVRQWLRAVAAKRLTRKLWKAEAHRITKRLKWPQEPDLNGYIESLCEGYRNAGYTPMEAIEEDCSYGD